MISPRPWWSLGRLCPALLALWLALDLGLRLAPVSQLGVSPIGAAQRFAGPHAPFEANTEIVAREVIGENALRGNLPPTEQRSRLIFSTDHLGYRANPELAPGAPIDLLVLGGDSFTYGANLSDQETFPAALTRLSGLNAYNGGRFPSEPMTLADLDWLLQRLPGTPRHAILLHLQQQVPALARDGDAKQGESRTAEPTGREQVWESFQRWWQASPLRNATRRLFRSIQNDRVLPNIHQDAIVSRSLPDGRSMLFRKSELAPVHRTEARQSNRKTADYLAWWRQQLAVRGMETIVVLMPTRYTLYGRFIERGAAGSRVKAARRDYKHLEQLLRQRGVRTLNAMELYQALAASDLKDGLRLFFLEDHHWTPSGVQRLARAVADSLQLEGGLDALQ